MLHHHCPGQTNGSLPLITILFELFCLANHRLQSDSPAVISTPVTNSHHSGTPAITNLVAQFAKLTAPRRKSLAANWFGFLDCISILGSQLANPKESFSLIKRNPGESRPSELAERTINYPIINWFSQRITADYTECAHYSVMITGQRVDCSCLIAFFHTVTVVPDLGLSATVSFGWRPNFAARFPGGPPTPFVHHSIGRMSWDLA